MGYQPARDNLRQLDPVPRHLRGGVQLDPSRVHSQTQATEARAPPSPPPDHQQPPTGGPELQDDLNAPVLSDEVQVRQPIVTNNTSVHTPPLPHAGNPTLSFSGDTSASDTQGAGSDLNQQHDSSGSNAAAAAAGAEASQMSASLRSQNKRGPDGTPLEGHPDFLNEEDIKFMNLMLQEWADTYPVDINCTKHSVPMITHDQANKRYVVSIPKVTQFNVTMLRNLKKQSKKEPQMSLGDRMKQILQVGKRSTKPSNT